MCSLSRRVVCRLIFSTRFAFPSFWGVCAKEAAPNPSRPIKIMVTNFFIAIVLLIIVVDVHQLRKRDVGVYQVLYDFLVAGFRRSRFPEEGVAQDHAQDHACGKGEIRAQTARRISLPAGARNGREPLFEPLEIPFRYAIFNLFIHSLVR